MFRKGSIFARHVVRVWFCVGIFNLFKLVRSLNSSFLFFEQKSETHHAPDGREFVRQRLVVSALHEDLIQDDFWARYPVIPLPSSSLQVAAAATAAAASVEVFEQGAASLTASDAEAAGKRGAEASDDNL